ncbi:hypothetical protein [Methylobacterium haplocladii]|uniref:hypothetical protein n=1 Tax=Methylobacterium haplocladii TaxID=1176176 RepID=UPI00158015AA
MRALIVAAATGLFATSALAKPQTLMDLFSGRDSAPCPRYQQSPQHFCNIVVRQPGGNPTQDMTGSIGHMKSYQSNGGPRCKVICRYTGSNYDGIR